MNRVNPIIVVPPDTVTYVCTRMGALDVMCKPICVPLVRFTQLFFNLAINQHLS
jgi:hypothetical protein